MRCTSADRGGMVLYHAVSSYQLLEVMLHRRLCHPRERAVLLLPDFIVDKYPQYRRLRSLGFFEEVYLFPYLRIPHGSEEQVMRDTARAYQGLVPHDIGSFSRVYVAGAHFYFSLYLIRTGTPFVFFEDAAGMLARWEELYEGLARGYPLHAQLARKYGLFDGSCPLAEQVICLKSAQRGAAEGARYADFSVREALLALAGRERGRLVRFFLRHPIRVRVEGILLTQQFANLGLMSREEQRALYQSLAEGPLQGVRLAIKRHPDDTLDYRDIFPHAAILPGIFPAELLPYVFRHRPDTVYTVSSTGCENLRGDFRIIRLE